MRCAITIALVLVASSVEAAVRVLIPLPITSAGQSIPGAYGSQWKTELDGYNGNSYSVYPQNCQTLCPQFGANSSFNGISSPLPQVWFFSELAADKISMNFHVRDVSREDVSWGTQIPLIRESDAFQRELSIVGIPTDDRYRLTLRIYDIDGRATSVVHVQYFAANGAQILEEDVTLVNTWYDGLPEQGSPGVATLNSLTEMHPSLRAGLLRIRITPVTSGLRFWAFISIANNQTQNVTTAFPN